MVVSLSSVNSTGYWPHSGVMGESLRDCLIWQIKFSLCQEFVLVLASSESMSWVLVSGCKTVEASPAVNFMWFFSIRKLESDLKNLDSKLDHDNNRRQWVLELYGWQNKVYTADDAS